MQFKGVWNTGYTLFLCMSLLRSLPLFDCYVIPIDTAFHLHSGIVFCCLGAIRFPTSTPLPPKRTHDEMKRDMEWALEYGTVVNGVKGPSPLLNLPHFDMVRGQTIDYMHCLLLGVTKQLTEAMLSASENGAAKGFYIGKQT